jgi:hypothetical protein
MSNVASEFAQNAQEQTLNSIKQSQQAIVEAVRAWAHAVEKSVPETPTVPFASELPTPQQLVHSSFDFAEQLLKTQRDFAENLVAAAGPVLDKSQPKES